jgi:hypothetical protein
MKIPKHSGVYTCAACMVKNDQAAVNSISHN